MKNLSICATCFFAISVTSAKAAFPRYHVTDLRTWQYGGNFSALNNHGDMAGSTTTGRLMVYDNTGLHQYAGSYPYNSLGANSITETGIVGGRGSIYYPYLWSKATGFEPLPRYGAIGGGLGSTSFRVTKFDESLNVASGYHEVKLNGAEDPHAVRWIKTNGTWTVEPSPTANGNVMWYGRDMNQGGTIFGEGNSGSSLHVPLYWSLGSGGVQRMSSPAGWDCDALSIGANEAIVGALTRLDASNILQSKLAIWHDELAEPELTDFSALPNRAIGEVYANRFGLVGLSASNATNGEDGRIAFLWSRESGFARISDLVEPGTPFHNYWSVRQLNDSGSMIVDAKVPGQFVWYQLRLDPVPEPSSLLLLTPGLAWVVLSKRKKQ